MADGVFGLEVVTPEQSLYAGGARSVVLATSEGDLTVLDGHTPLVGDVVPCEVRVEPGEGDGPLAGRARRLRAGRHQPRRGRRAGRRRRPAAGALHPGHGAGRRGRAVPRRSTRRAPKPPARPHPSVWPTCRRVAASGEDQDQALALAEAEGALARAELRVEVAAGKS